MSKIELVLGDITTLKVDAIVNAANSNLSGGGGVDGAIHKAAGPEPLKECAKIALKRRPLAPCPTGEAVITGAGKLPSNFIIHTAGPIWRGGGHGEPEALASCYRNCLLLARENSVESIAFPNISAGVYGYPKEKAARLAIETVRETLVQTPGIKRVVFVCFDKENYSLYQSKIRGMGEC